MEEKKTIKIKLNIIIAIVLVILSILGIISFIAFSKKSDSSISKIISMSKNEIKSIANNNGYKIKDKQLRKFYNKILGEGILIVSGESAKTIKDAERQSIEYKNKFYKSFDEADESFEYIDFEQTDYYYKYIGKYTNKNEYVDGSDHIAKYTFLIFKSDYFDYPYLKKHSDEYSIKEFGDMLAILNFRYVKYIKSTVEENAQKYTYNLYYIRKSMVGASQSGSWSYGVMPETYYALQKATFSVDKTTGKINLDINQESYIEEYLDYKNSYHPHMNYENIKEF